jgi:hypothetical protein
MMTQTDASKEEESQTQQQMEVATFRVPLNDESRPVRRSGKDRDRFKGEANSLDKSFTEFLESTPDGEIEEFSTQIESTLRSLPKSVSESLVKVERRPSGEHYAPVRRPSRAGSELAKSMKEIAQKALLELGDLDDDTDDEVGDIDVGKVKIQR